VSSDATRPVPYRAGGLLNRRPLDAFRDEQPVWPYDDWREIVDLDPDPDAVV
jgi:hypothetical protein